MDTQNPAVEQANVLKRLLFGFYLLLLLTAIAAAAFFYLKYREIRKNPSIISQQETKDILARVGELIILPENETPTIATITNPDALKNQAFFAHAKKGDKVLIYTTLKKAILYDPLSNKIIEVAPVNLGSSGSAGITTDEKTK